MGELAPSHWLVVLAVVALLFGSAKLPEIARSLGRSARILKAESRGMREDANAAQPDRPSTQQTS